MSLYSDRSTLDMRRDMRRGGKDQMVAKDAGEAKIDMRQICAKVCAGTLAK